MLYEVETYILLSRFAIVDNNITEASSMLEEASNIVKKHKLVALESNIEHEKKLLEEQFQVHGDLVSRNADLQERLQASKIDEYLQFDLQQKIEQ